MTRPMPQNTRSEDIALRPVRASEDAAALAAIYAEYVRGAWVSFEVEPPTPTEMQSRAEAILARGLPYLVAERVSSGAILGYVYASPYRPRAAYQSSVENSIYLDASAHRQGVGTALMDALVEACKALDLKTMVAIVGLDPSCDVSDNQSVRFHQNYGFKFVGVLENIGHKFGRWTGTAMLTLSLTDD